MQHCLQHGDSTQYVLDKFAIMPNHVHILVKPLEPHSLRNIVHGWKSLSAGHVNRLTGSSGQLWTHESFDHIVRSWRDLERFRLYVEQNPARARLPAGQYLVGQGSGLIP